MQWIHPKTVLTGKIVELIPLQKIHFEELELLTKDKRIWEYFPIDMSTTEKCYRIFDSALILRRKGSQFPFVIYHRHKNKIIGSTRLMNIEPEHRKLEIGWTWLHPDYWATAVNLECKLLLLTFCFEKLQTIRVQLKTDEKNIRSQKAIQKIGGQYEGILRHDMIRDNGIIRNSAYFSIIHTEWEQVKENLTTLLKNKINI